MISADLATEDDGELIGLADRAVGIHQSLAESIHGSPARKYQVIARLDLREEQPVFNAGLLTFPGSEEWDQLRERFAAAAGPTQHSPLETHNAKGWRPDTSSISRISRAPALG